MPRLIILSLLLAGCSVTDPGVVVAQRLTPTEYNNTVRDLYGYGPGSGAEWPTAFDDEEEEEVSPWPISFPADIEVHGFEGMVDGQISSAYLIERYQASAAHFAPYAVGAPIFLACDSLSSASEPEACAWNSVLRFTQRAWRRPITESEQQRLRAFHDANVAKWGVNDGITLSVEGVLLAPQFLYRIEDVYGDGGKKRGDYVQLDDYELASRLSYLLWDSMPDQELFAAAADGSLRKDKGLREQAARMLRDVRARDAMVHFHSQWLDLDAIFTANADQQTYMPLYLSSEIDEGDFEEDVLEQEAFEEAWSNYLIGARVAMVREAELYIAESLSSGGRLRDLLTSTKGYASTFGEEDHSHNTYGVYGIDQSAGRSGSSYEMYVSDGNFDYNIQSDPVSMPADQRAGVLTLGAVLAGKAHPVHPAPILRGVFVLEHLACETLGQPPDSAAGSAPADTLDSSGTNRERVEAVTQPPECIACHDRINAAGFAFEGYDAMGGHRTEDNGQPVDASGTLSLSGGETFSFNDAIGLAEGLSTSRQVHDCYAQHWARYALGGDPEPAALATLQEAFYAREGDIHTLILDIVTSDMFRYRRAN